MPTAEDRQKGDETKSTWADYADKIFFNIMNRQWNDPFDVIDSAKAEEHVRRNCIYGNKMFTSRQLMNFQIKLIFQHFSPINQIR